MNKKSNAVLPLCPIRQYAWVRKQGLKDCKNSIWISWYSYFWVNFSVCRNSMNLIWIDSLKSIICDSCLVSRCLTFCLHPAESSIEGLTSPSLLKDLTPSSPMSDRKKTKRKKSMNVKGDAAAIQADGKHHQKHTEHLITFPNMINRL